MWNICPPFRHESACETLPAEPGPAAEQPLPPPKRARLSNDTSSRLAARVALDFLVSEEPGFLARLRAPRAGATLSLLAAPRGGNC